MEVENSTVPKKSFKSNKNLLDLFGCNDLVGIFSGAAFLVTVPCLHLGLFFKFWVDKKPIDPHNCTNSCWDTIFKGSYESEDSPGYHHVYFNATHQTVKIWTVTICYALATYETCKLVARLAIEGNLRLLMLAPLLGSVFPHYYSWWMYFNYWNDDFYTQWYHQLFFSITELVSTVVILDCCDATKPLNPFKLLAVADIAVVHIVTASGDQFWKNLVRGRGYQRVRDVGFMIPDLVNLFVPIVFLSRLAYQRGMSVLKLIQHRIGLSVIIVAFLCILCWSI